MANFNCEAKIAAVEGLEADQMTVGRHLNLHCLADAPLAESHKYTLSSEVNPEITYKVFQIKKTDHSKIELEMTFYKAGQFQLTDFKIFDGNESHSLLGAPITVQSVLKPSQDGKPQKPYDPIFPLTMSIPKVYFAYLLIGISVVILYFILKLRRLRRYKKLKEKLKNYDSPIDPDVQFYRSVRAAEKLGYPLENLDNAFRLYNLRSYRLPIFDMNDEKLNKYFKHNFPQYKNTRIQLFRILGDIEKLKKTGQEGEISPVVKKDLITKMYRFVETHRGVERE